MQQQQQNFSVVAKQYESMARDAAATEVAQVRQQLTAHYDARWQNADRAIRSDAQAQAQRLQERLLHVEQSAGRRLTSQANEFNTSSTQASSSQRNDLSRSFKATYDQQQAIISSLTDQVSQLQNGNQLLQSQKQSLTGEVESLKQELNNVK